MIALTWSSAKARAEEADEAKKEAEARAEQAEAAFAERVSAAEASAADGRALGHRCEELAAPPARPWQRARQQRECVEHLVLQPTVVGVRVVHVARGYSIPRQSIGHDASEQSPSLARHWRSNSLPTGIDVVALWAPSGARGGAPTRATRPCHDSGRAGSSQ